MRSSRYFKKTLIKAPFILLLVLTFCGGAEKAAAAVATESLNRRCIGCHDDHLYRTLFFNSVHAENGCISCHGDIRDLPRHASGALRSGGVDCGKCHEGPSAAYLKNPHYLREDIRCYDCHRDIHAMQRQASSKAGIIGRCTRCHSGEQYVARGHGGKVLQGDTDSASCRDCHGVHDTPYFPEHGTKASPAERVWYSGRCISCHADREMMERHGVSTTTVRDYERTYHGKVSKAGYPAHVAGCADCHRKHNILPASDPKSALCQLNLEIACGQCHHGFQLRFVKFNAHPDYGSRKKYPALFWTSVFMEILLVSVFAFFWLHTGLWWRKSYWEKCRRDREQGAGSPCESDQIQRFPVLYRVMHFLLILSFFTLVLTGIPLKFSGSDWGRTILSILGGVGIAGILHRIAAVVLSALFFYTVWLSLRFLFPGGFRDLGTRGWIDRLFSPDSLFPNSKDLQDMKGMFLWFFNRGEAPRFDRWTYWEKFDFLAVFWGMVAIGGSGVILWFPEAFSYIFPGWIINVATIVHSEEALLAALFIFTVHFFNNHLVPDKFPLEPNIFTGKNSLDQLRRERPLEYERLVEEGRLDELKRQPAGNLARLLFGALGLVSLLLGLILVFMIVWTVVFVI